MTVRLRIPLMLKGMLLQLLTVQAEPSVGSVPAATSFRPDFSGEHAMRPAGLGIHRLTAADVAEVRANIGSGREVGHDALARKVEMMLATLSPGEQLIRSVR